MYFTCLSSIIHVNCVFYMFIVFYYLFIMYFTCLSCLCLDLEGAGELVSDLVGVSLRVLAVCFSAETVGVLLVDLLSPPSSSNYNYPHVNSYSECEHSQYIYIHSPNICKLHISVIKCCQVQQIPKILPPKGYSLALQYLVETRQISKSLPLFKNCR